jgi:hypothetical protein
VRVNVTIKTDREFLQHIGFVRLAMAGGAFGNEPVTGVAFRTVDLTMFAGSGLPFGVDVAVASAAGSGVHVAVKNNVGVGAREFDELLILLSMALPAGVGENFTHGHLQGSMGIGVALQAICKLLAMRRFGMAAEALGHDLRPIVFDRVVGMELLMAPMAVEPMLAAGFLEIPENANMTLAALGYGQWWRFHGIKITSSRLFLPARRIGMTP